MKQCKEKNILPMKKTMLTKTMKMKKMMMRNSVADIVLGVHYDLDVPQNFCSAVGLNSYQMLIQQLPMMINSLPSQYYRRSTPIQLVILHQNLLLCLMIYWSPYLCENLILNLILCLENNEKKNIQYLTIVFCIYRHFTQKIYFSYFLLVLAMIWV